MTNKILATLKSLVVFSLVSLSLFCVFWNEYPDGYFEHKKNYKSIIKNRNTGFLETISNHQEKLKKLYPNDKILQGLSQDLSKEYNTILESSKTNLREYTKTKKEYELAHSFRGRSSFHFWLMLFGLVSALFYFACKSLFDDISKGSHFRHQFVSIAGLIVSGFWFVHLVFYTQNDFLQNKYIGVILISSVLFSFFTYFLIKYYAYKDQIIYSLLSFIKRVKNKHYKEIAVKALYSEKTGKPLVAKKTTNESIDEFDEDLLTTVKDL